MTMGTNMQEFKFPDELNADVPVGDDPEVKVEVVDDTPVEDRGRQPMPKEVVEDLENDDLEQYSETVRKRLKQMKKVWHDERREKEAAQRERDEAARFAAAQVEENRNLKKRLGVGEKLFVQEVNKAATNELTVAREKLKAAYESNDAGEIAAAQEALTDAKMKQREMSQLRPSLQEDGEEVQQATQAQTTPVTVDPKAAAWREKNRWFGSDPEMTALALGLHDKLVRSGMSPVSDEYYDTINKTMRKRFPEEFTDEVDTKGEQETTSRQRSQDPAPRRAATTVAPATRTTAPRQVRLTPSQVAIAKRLGLTNEAYAKELIKLEKANG